jgi:hypothetical protein
MPRHHRGAGVWRERSGLPGDLRARFEGESLIRVDEDRARYELAVCLEGSEAFGAIGECYDDFTQTSDEEVAAALGSAASPAPA